MLLLADVCADIQWKDNCGLLQLGSYFRTHFIRASFLLLLITFYLSKQLLTSGDTVILLKQSWTEQGKTNQAQKKLCIGSLAKISKLIRCEASTKSRINFTRKEKCFTKKWGGHKWNSCRISVNVKKNTPSMGKARK